MSLDFYLTCPCCDSWVYDRNITHNLGKMAMECKLYDYMWGAEENGYKTASELIPFLEKGVAELTTKPDYYKKFNPGNNWGSYEGLVSFAVELLEKCKKHPDSLISVSR